MATPYNHTKGLEDTRAIADQYEDEGWGCGFDYYCDYIEGNGHPHYPVPAVKEHMEWIRELHTNKVFLFHVKYNRFTP